MRSPSRLVTVALLLAVFRVGCSTTSIPAFHAPYFQSRDGGFSYRIPAGWYDASADSQSTGHAVWLLRNDYGATIAVNELHVDSAARGVLRDGGITQLATLSMTLAAAGKAYVLGQAPQTSHVNGRVSCVYQLVTTPASDVLRVVLVDTGRKVYMVTALVPAETKVTARDDVFSVQEAFLNSVRW